MVKECGGWGEIAVLLGTGCGSGLLVVGAF